MAMDNNDMMPNTLLGYVYDLNVLLISLLLDKNLHPMSKHVLPSFLFSYRWIIQFCTIQRQLKRKGWSIKTFGPHAYPLSRGYKIPDINLAQKNKLELQSSISFDYLTTF